MSLTVFPEDVHVDGTLSAKNFKAPIASIDDSAIESLAGIQASKVIHRWAVSLFQPPGTAVIAQTWLAHIVSGATGRLAGVQAAVITQASGADREISIDVQRGNAGSAFATVLTAPLVLDDATPDRAPQSATVTGADQVAGDIIKVSAAVSGAAGAQAQGLIITLFFEEAPL